MKSQNELREFLQQLLRKAGRDQSPGDDQSLFMSGYLDSLAAVQLVTFLEENFGLGTEEDFSIWKIDTWNRILHEVKMAQERARK